MNPQFRKEFDRYWSDRIPGMVEYTRYVLNNDTDFNHTMRVFLKDVSLGSRIIDMGSGIGVVALEAARMGFKVDALDCNSDVIDAGKALAKEMGLNIRYMVGDMADPSSLGKGYDVIIARNSVWCLEEPMKAYSRWRDLLRPGG